MEKDINDIFDEVSMGEEKFYKEGYSDGFKKGYQQAFDLDPSGYSCGIEASYEIAMYHAFLTVPFNDKLSRHSLKMLKDFKEELDNFNTTSPKVISDKLKSLKINYNKLCCALMLPNERNGTESADMSF